VAILWLQYMTHVTLLPVTNVCIFPLVLYEIIIIIIIISSSSSSNSSSSSSSSGGSSSSSSSSSGGSSSSSSSNVLGHQAFESANECTKNLN